MSSSSSSFLDRFLPPSQVSISHHDNLILETTDRRNHWLIVTFTDNRYLPVAKVWYTQLEALGYKNVVAVWETLFN